MQIEHYVNPVYLYIEKQMWNKYLKDLVAHPSSWLAKTNIAQSFNKSVESLSQDMSNKVLQPIPAYFNGHPWKIGEVEIKLDLPSKQSIDDYPLPKQELHHQTLEMLSTQYQHYVKI